MRFVFIFGLLYSAAAYSAVFRVLVFPHQGTYTEPQGKEKVVNQVDIQAPSQCYQYQADINEQGEWVKKGNVLSEGKTIHLAVDQFSSGQAYYFECQQGFQVIRERGLRAISYSGHFVAMKQEQKETIQLINLVQPEEYLKGVVPSEVGADWPEEALKAQAVAARTYAWWTVLEARKKIWKPYDLTDTVQHQVYLGVDTKTNSTNQAVDTTSFQVMTFQGAVIKAYFSADNGGVSESAIHVFGDDLPYCVSKKEIYDIEKVSSSWSLKLDLSAVGKAFSKSIIRIVDITKNSSGRVQQLSLLDKQGKKTIVKGSEFRLKMKLRSTLFDIEEGWIKGRGYGHGVGMAQVGAREYARLGWSFQDILKFYYSGVLLELMGHE